MKYQPIVDVRPLEDHAGESCVTVYVPVLPDKTDTIRIFTEDHKGALVATRIAEAIGAKLTRGGYIEALESQGAKNPGISKYGISCTAHKVHGVRYRHKYREPWRAADIALEDEDGYNILTFDVKIGVEK